MTTSFYNNMPYKNKPYEHNPYEKPNSQLAEEIDQSSYLSIDDQEEKPDSLKFREPRLYIAAAMVFTFFLLVVQIKFGQFVVSQLPEFTRASLYPFALFAVGPVFISFWFIKTVRRRGFGYYVYNSYMIAYGFIFFGYFALLMKNRFSQKEDIAGVAVISGILICFYVFQKVVKKRL